MLLYKFNFFSPLLLRYRFFSVDFVVKYDPGIALQFCKVMIMLLPGCNDTVPTNADVHFGSVLSAVE